MSSVYMNGKGVAALVSAIYEQAAEDMLYGYRLTKVRKQDVRIQKQDIKTYGLHSPCNKCVSSEDGSVCHETCEEYDEYLKKLNNYKAKKAKEAHIKGWALIKECERFFRDDPYMQLHDPEYIIEKLRLKGRYKNDRRL